jgi:hypothetical protein
VDVPETFLTLHGYLPGLIGSQIVKLETIPDVLNSMVDCAEEDPDETKAFRHTVVFEITDDWVHKIEVEMQRLTRLLVG